MRNITNVRREVTTLANRLNQKIKNLSSAFIRAWHIVKGRMLVSKIAGVTFGTRQRALDRLRSYSREDVNVTLEREANNPHDANAVKVMVNVHDREAYHLGYIPAALAKRITPLLDKGIQLIAMSKGVTGGYAHKENYGGLIEISL